MTAPTVNPPRSRPSARPGRRQPVRRARARDAVDAGASHRSRRLTALFVTLVLMFGVIGTRLVLIQGLAADRYANFGRSQRIHNVVLPAQRGSILDRNGAALALSTRRRTVWADPKQVRDPAGAARVLAPILGAGEDELRTKLGANAGFVYLARKVDDKAADQVEGLEIPGVSLLDEPQRVSPAAPLGSSVLGTVGLDDKGLSGLELQYEEDLAGRPGELIVERDPRGRSIASGTYQQEPPERGDHLTLTIDRSLQFEIERILGEQIVATRAEAGTAVVMDPHTGEILAMANLRGQSGGPPVPAPTNMALTNVYEPGSVNKLITVAAAIEEGVVSPSDTFVVPDRISVAGSEFHDSSPHETVRMTTSEIVSQSSNVGTILIGRKLNKDRLDRYLRAFGLGAVTGLRFPGESAGLLLDPDEWSGTSMATIAMGQGMAVTAVQMLAAYNVIANGGTYVAPKLVQGVVDAGGRRHLPRYPADRRVVSETTAQKMTPILEEVVRSGTGELAAVEGYRVAGKTGTAQKVREGARGYQPGAYIATFAGFLPASSPRLSAIVVLDEPTPYYGGLASGPVFARIAAFAARYLKLPTDRPITPVSAPGAPLSAGSREPAAPPATLEGSSPVLD